MASTEDGAYTLNGSQNSDTTLPSNPGALYVIADQDDTLDPWLASNFYIATSANQQTLSLLPTDVQNKSSFWDSTAGKIGGFALAAGAVFLTKGMVEEGGATDSAASATATGEVAQQDIRLFNSKS